MVILSSYSKAAYNNSPFPDIKNLSRNIKLNSNLPTLVEAASKKNRKLQIGCQVSGLMQDRREKGL